MGNYWLDLKDKEDKEENNWLDLEDKKNWLDLDEGKEKIYKCQGNFEIKGPRFF